MFRTLAHAAFGAVIGGLSLSGVAAAADFTIHPSKVLVPESGSFYENGVGSPTVAYDDVNGRYVMFFETRLNAATIAALGINSAQCRNGAVWGIGWATSSDGITGWAVQGTMPIIAPEAGSYYACVTAHPNVVKDGSTFRVFFKAEQSHQTAVNCPTGSPPPTWGCAQQTGVGLANVTFSGGTPSVTIMAAPSLMVSGFGFPAVAKIDGTWNMWLSKQPDLYLATATSPAGPFTLGAQPVLRPGQTSWTPDRIFELGVACYNGSRIPYTMYLGGKDLDDTQAVVANALGEALSPTGSDWYVGAVPELSWTGDSGFRHWDVVRVAPSDTCDTGLGENYVMWFAERNATTTLIEVGVAYTSATWNPADTLPKVCTSSSPTAFDGDFQPLDAGGVDPYADTGGAAPAGCATGGSTPGAAGLLLPLLALAVQRNRRSGQRASRSV